MTVVRIPPVLRAETGDQREVDVAGSTVREVLETLVETFPGLDGRVLDNGTLQSFINVYLDGTDVDTFDGLDTPVNPDATLLLLPAMAGGSTASVRDDATASFSSPSQAVRRELTATVDGVEHCGLAAAAAVSHRPL